MDFRDHELPITPPSTPDYTDYDDDTNYDDEPDIETPLSQEDVNELCGTRPPTIKVEYLTLHLKAALSPASLPETWRVLEAQKIWEGDIYDWFAANQYKVIKRGREYTGFYWSFPRGLETFARFMPNCDFNYQAFQMRSELDHEAPTSRLSRNVLIFIPVPKCERDAAFPFEE
ncbi:hypothetical protein Focb16_v006024 [Fusarium oxysporum f. sp. cubense]|uniref:Uncharacterized protein n=2 Tax=Fusarium oxysporum f. sp. cubense TaxID=61366 RepID=N4U7T8_FUSC1|nr:hypothetical protein FOC1_g10001137 [Fusarium oxysporum f. sp. cubense race 1]TVY74651.1 hypothetical protein Focb16_v006024 [Fusarium oxysporum f. sp. cubense]